MRLHVQYRDPSPRIAEEGRDRFPLLGTRGSVPNLVQICLASLLLLLIPARGVLSQTANGSEASAERRQSARDTVSIQEAEQLIDLLDTSLGSLAEEDRRGRRVGGYVLVGLGAGSAVGGIATLAAGAGDDAKIVGYSLIGGGALLGGLSLIPFKIRTEPERMYAEFQQMPAEGPDQIRRKQLYWDRRFQELAEKRRRERIIEGVTSIVAAGLTSIVLVEGSDQGRLHTFVWPALGGITRLLVKTEEEQRYETYRRAREDIVRDRSESALEVGVGPIPTGGFLGFLRVRF